MEIVEITKDHIVTGAEHSSKGNQLKWKVDGYWYKADAFGYESLAETVVSHLLKQSTLDYFVTYEPVKILYKGKEYRGCRSENFCKEKDEIIPLERLARTFTGFGLARELAHISDVKQRVCHAVELVQNVTGMEDFGVYLTKALEIDAFFLNEDRHTNNIAVLYNVAEKEYRLCPFFDMGLSLFSDTREAYPIEKDLEWCHKQITAKPFCRAFDEQLDAANELYGDYLKFYIDRRGIEKVVDEIVERLGCRELYSREEIDRVKDILRLQAEKYQYMFKK